ncbi:MAG: transglutaminase family protein [Anaerolineae bacterium]|nr:transglutaminase family protein [Anaerolineales bacterium]MCQ3974033.1 transglutaminase family protein [Anaerolineae bacterium]
MYYSIRHITRFRYSASIHESVMELRMQPRDEGRQRRHSFDLAINPRAQVMQYRDYLGNTVHHFDIPGQHTQLIITAQAMVELSPPPPLPDALGADAWEALDQLAQQGDYWEMLAPSHFARPTGLLADLSAELNLQREADPLTTLRRLNTALHDAFDYKPNGTKVDSPIDESLQKRQGVCQDFAHIMTALVRQMGIPCRYISGYLFHRREDHDRSEADATHAWVEALLPELGWIGFDPTNNLIAGDRHIRVAIGRDYADVPPTRGVFKGDARSELSVAVQVRPADEAAVNKLSLAEPELPPLTWLQAEVEAETEVDFLRQQQQQQQQQ